MNILLVPVSALGWPMRNQSGSVADFGQQNNKNKVGVSAADRRVDSLSRADGVS